MKRKHKSPPFVMIRLDLLRDPKWRKLSSSAKILYIYLRSKFNSKNLGEVSLSYGEIGDMLSSRTVSKAFGELLDGGWIEKIKQGGLFGGVCTYKFKGEYKDIFYRQWRV